jgi:hypothetical protein
MVQQALDEGLCRLEDGTFEVLRDLLGMLPALPFVVVNWKGAVLSGNKARRAKDTKGCGKGLAVSILQAARYVEFKVCPPRPIPRSPDKPQARPGDDQAVTDTRTRQCFAKDLPSSLPPPRGRHLGILVPGANVPEQDWALSLCLSFGGSEETVNPVLAGPQVIAQNIPQNGAG